jgi:hypothetical protein
MVSIGSYWFHYQYPNSATIARIGAFRDYNMIKSIHYLSTRHLLVRQELYISRAGYPVSDD